MNNYKFSRNSIEKLGTCNKDLQKIFNLAITRSKIDFGISEGYRSLSRQQQLFKEGKSKIDGINKTGKHNLTLSEAVDIYTYHPNINTRRKLAYDKIHLSYLAGVIDCCANELFEKDKITHLIRWGANWNRNGIIDYDQIFDDYPHFELVKIKTNG